MLSFGVAGNDLSLQQRIEHIIAMVGGPTKAASIAGVSRTTIDNWRSKTDANLPLDGMLRLAEKAGVSLDWVATGYQVRPDIQQQRPPPSEGGNMPTNDFALIPRLVVEASAGGGAIVQEEEVGELLAFRSDWLRRRGVNPSAAQVLTVRGDSMEPTIRNGDILLVDRSIDQIRDEGIYVVVVAGYVKVKRLQIRRDGTLVLKSDNNLYDEDIVPPDEVTDIVIAGRVMWFGRSI